jgi:hypothetical protein
MRKTSIAFSLALMMALPLLGQSSLLVGTWKVNIEKSKYSPGPPPKANTIKWEPVQGGFKFTTDGVDAKGQTNHSETMEKTDGSEGQVEGAQTPNTTRGLKRIDDHNYEDVDKVGGKTVATRRLVISADSKTLTVTVKGTNAQGEAVNNVALYEKQ